MNKTFKLTPRVIAKLFFFIVGVLLSANLMFLLLEHGLDLDFHSIHIFYFNQEGNIPTIYSSFAILIAAALLWVISNLTSERKLTGYWRFLSLLFIFLAFDELLSIHETLTDNIRDLLGSYARGFLHFAWVVPYIILCVIIVTFLIRFLLILPRGTRHLFIIAAFTFVFGAVGLEVAGGNFIYFNGEESRQSLTYALIVTLEELLEMVGIVIFIYALSCYYIDHLSDGFVITLDVVPDRKYYFDLSPDNKKEE